MVLVEESAVRRSWQEQVSSTVAIDVPRQPHEEYVTAYKHLQKQYQHTRHPLSLPCLHPVEPRRDALQVVPSAVA